MLSSNRRIIRLFESVPKFETYSQYSNNLEKVFHENSLKNLIKNLKEERKPKIYSYFNVDDQQKESNKFNIFKHKKRNKKDNSKNNLLYDEEDINKNKEIENKNRLNTVESYGSFNKRIVFSPDSDRFRYNPNYNSIMKKIPCVKIIKTSNINNKRHTTFLTEVGDIAMSSNNLLSKKKYDLKKTNLPNIKILKEIYNRKKKIPLDLNELRNNHSLRFDKIQGRKEIKSDINPNVSYIEPYDYQKIKNNSTDFNKMLSRVNIKIENKEKSEGPSIGYYEPNYEYLEDRVRNISLGNEHTNKRDKKFLLKKLWGSYNVRMEYLLIDNNKLNNDVLKNNDEDKPKYKAIHTEPNESL